MEEGSSRSAVTEDARGVKGPKLPLFVDEQDDLDAYLERFELFARR